MTQFGFRMPDFPLDGADSATFHQQVRDGVAAVAEGGYDSVWIPDHLMPWSDVVSDDTPIIECWTSLTYFSALYPHLTWAPLVLAQSFRNPAVMAKMVAALAAFIPGKFIFGIGAGWREREYHAYNFPFPKLSTRLREMEEAIEIAKRLWSGERVTYEGRYYQVYDCVVSPVPDPPVPVLIGGEGEQITLRLVAKHADSWNFRGGPVEVFQRKMDVLKRHCDDVGRDFGEIEHTWSSFCTAVAHSEDEARRIAQSDPLGKPDQAIYGTPDQLVRAFRERAEAGVDHFQLRFADFPSTDGIELFAREVLPHFKD
jgi:alkanesulfonate monooxygenase SsuD/methylene tetrahydromethanopterin reductase-like flavin-dependent oxidoreductase (luciferase family)